MRSLYSFRTAKSIWEEGNRARSTRMSGEARTTSPMELNRITSVLFGVSIAWAKYVEFYAGAIMPTGRSIFRLGTL